MAELGPVPGSYSLYRPKVVERTVVPINRSTIDQILVWINPVHVTTSINRAKDTVTWTIAYASNYGHELYLREGEYLMFTPEITLETDVMFRTVGSEYLENYFEDVVTDA